jgi:hypothetical protein
MEGFCIKCHIVIPGIQGEYCFKCGTRLFVRPPENQIGSPTDLVAGIPANVDVRPPTRGQDYTNLPHATDTHGAPLLQPKATDGTYYPPLQSRLSEVEEDDTILVHRTIPDRTKPNIGSGGRMQSGENIEPQELRRPSLRDSEHSYNEQHPTREAVKQSTSLDHNFIVEIPRPRNSRDDRSRSPTRLGSEELGSRHKDHHHPPTPFHSDSSFRNSTTPLTSSEELGADDTIASAQLAHIMKVISNLKKSKFSEYFRNPVDYVKLNLPSYPTIITNPMDLTTIRQKLTDKRYNTLSEFVADFELIINNCARFNGPEHSITQLGMKMQTSFRNQTEILPPATNH